MRTRSANLMTLIAATYLIAHSAFLQILAMDLSRDNIVEYLANDMRLSPWWLAVGIPFVLGISYLVIWASTVALHAGRGARLLMQSMFLGAAILLSLFSPTGYPAVLFTAVALILVVRELRHGR